MSLLTDLQNKLQAQAGSLPMPVAGPSRQWTPTPMPNIPFMPQANVGPQSIARNVMPGAPNTTGPTAPNVAPPAPGGAPQQSFWQRIGAAMRGMPQGGQMNPLMMWVMALKSGLARPGMPQMPQGMNPGAVMPPRPMITPMNPGQAQMAQPNIAPMASQGAGLLM